MKALMSLLIAVVGSLVFAQKSQAGPYYGGYNPGYNNCAPRIIAPPVCAPRIVYVVRVVPRSYYGGPSYGGGNCNTGYRSGYYQTRGGYWR